MYECTKKIREVINNPRKQHTLLKNRNLWNQLCSCLDVIEDSQEAIDAYSSIKVLKGKGGIYLAVYGLLQAIYVQQDAIKNLGESLKIPISLKDYPALEYIRKIRNRSIGHPTKKDKPKSEPKSYHFISRTTLCHKGFQLHSYHDDGKSEFKDISIVELIADQKKYISDILTSIVHKLEQEEVAHKEKFRAEKLASTFPDSLDYYFQKLLESTEMKGQNKLGLIKESLNKYRFMR